MASEFSKNYSIELLATGERAGTWGAATNVNLARFESMCGGVVSISLTGIDATSVSPYQLQATDESAPNSSSGVIPEASGGRAKVVKFSWTTDAFADNRYVKLEDDGTNRFYIIENNTATTSGNLIFKSGGSDITIAKGESKLIYLLAGNATDILSDITVDNLTSDTITVTGVLTLGNNLTFTSSNNTITFDQPADIVVSDGEATAFRITDGSSPFITLDTHEDDNVEIGKSLSATEGIIIPTAKKLSIPKRSPSVDNIVSASPDVVDTMDVFAHAARHLFTGSDPLRLADYIRYDYQGTTAHQCSSGDAFMASINFDFSGRSGVSTVFFLSNVSFFFGGPSSSKVQLHLIHTYGTVAGATSGLSHASASTGNVGGWSTYVNAYESNFASSSTYGTYTWVGFKNDVPAAASQVFEQHMSVVQLVNLTVAKIERATLIAFDLGVS